MTNSDNLFPVSNILDKHIKKVAKATTTNTTITLQCNRYNAIAIFNTNAETISVNGGEILTLGSIYESIGQVAREHNKLIVFDDMKSGEVRIELNSSENIFVGLIVAGVIKKYGYTLWSSKDSIVDASKVEESINGSALIINRGFRMDKSFKVSSTYSEFVSLIQLLEEKRDSSNPFMVFASYDSMKIDSFTHLKYGYALMPTNIEENPARITYDLVVKESKWTISQGLQVGSKI